MKRGLLFIHLAVLLFGLSGLFGKTISLHAIDIVWWRTGFAAIFLALSLTLQKERGPRPAVKERFILIVLGALLAVHWATFFHAIQTSTVAIGLLTFSSFPVFVVFLEPWVLGEKLRLRAVGLAFLGLLGVALVVPDLDISNDHTVGALWGVVSGALFAVLTVFNRRYVGRFSAMTIGLWQNASAFLCLSAFALPGALSVSTPELGWLVLLGVVFTGGAHVMFIAGMKSVPARTASLIGILEPVYGVAAAFLLLGEVPVLRTLGGGVLIISTVLLASLNASPAAT